MKRKFSSNSQVIHVWAQQSQPYGESSSVYFDGKAVYSYGSHFPMAVFIKNKQDERKVLINNQSYSVTTSGHQSEVRQAVNHYESVYGPTGLLKLFIERSHNTDFKKQLLEYCVKDIELACINAAYRASQRKQARSKEKELLPALNAYSAYIGLFEFMGYKMPAKASKAVESLRKDYKTTLAASEKSKAKALKARQERDRLAAIEYNTRALDYLPIWLSCQGHEQHKISQLDKIYMRLNGEEIETSRGARFPVKDALPAFKIITQVREHGHDINPHGVKLGHFEVATITKEGHVKAACHYVEYDQIERIAKELDLV